MAGQNDVSVNFRANSGEIDKAAASFGALDTKANQFVEHASGGFGGLIGKVSTFGYTMFGLSAAIAPVQALGKNIKDLFSSNIQFETMTSEFSVLLGGIDNAKARIEELTEFARATPFELPQVVQASKTLEVMTKGALATGDGLKLVGDVASGTGMQFTEAAMWLGRLYDGLMNGRPVGEAMMRLQEMGAVSGETRTQIEEMQKAGVDGAAVWGVAADSFGRYSGMMEAKAKTVGGALSNISDGWNMIKRKLMEGVFQEIAPGFTAMANFLGSPAVQAGAIQFGQKLGELATMGIKPLVRGFGELIAVGKDVVGFFLDVKGAMQGAADWATGASSGYVFLVDATAKLGESLKWLGEEIFGRIIRDAMEVWGDFTDKLSSFGGGEGDWMQTMAGYIDQFADAISNLSPAQIDLITRAIEALLLLFVAKAAVGVISGVAGELYGLGNTVIGFPVRTLKGIYDHFESLYQTLSKPFKTPEIDCPPDNPCVDDLNKKMEDIQKKDGMLVRIGHQIQDKTETAALKWLLFLDKFASGEGEPIPVKWKLEGSTEDGGGFKLPELKFTMPKITAPETDMKSTGAKMGQSIATGLMGALGGAMIGLAPALAAFAVPAAIILAAALAVALAAAFPEQTGYLVGVLAAVFFDVFVGIPAILVVAGATLGATLVGILADGVKAAGGVLKEVFVNLPSAIIGDFTNAFKNVFAGFGDILVGIVTGDWGKVKDGAKQIFDAIAQLPMDLFSSFSVSFGNIGGIIKNFASGALSDLQGWGSSVLSMFTGLISNLGVSLKWDSIWEGLKTAGAAAITWLTSWGGEFIKGFGKAFSDVTGFTKDDVQKLYEAVTTKIGELKDKVVEIITGIPAALGDLSQALVQKGKDLIGGLWSGIGDIGDTLATKISSGVGAAKTLIGDVSRWLWDIGTNLAGGIAQGMIDGAVNAVQRAVSWIGGALPGWAKSILGISSPSKVMIPIGYAVSEGMAVGIEEGWGRVTESLTAGAATIPGLASDYEASGKPLGYSIITGAAKGVEEAAPSLGPVAGLAFKAVVPGMAADAFESGKTVGKAYGEGVKAGVASVNPFATSPGAQPGPNPFPVPGTNYPDPGAVAGGSKDTLPGVAGYDWEWVPGKGWTLVTHSYGTDYYGSDKNQPPPKAGFQDASHPGMTWNGSMWVLDSVYNAQPGKPIAPYTYGGAGVASDTQAQVKVEINGDVNITNPGDAAKTEADISYLIQYAGLTGGFAG